jgi:hypothetical protein
MLTDQETIKAVRTIAGLTDATGKDLTQVESFIREAQLIKIDLNRIDLDGWLIQIKESGRRYWAECFMPFFESSTPEGKVQKNILTLNPIIDVLVYQDKTDEGWRILIPKNRCAKINEPGVKYIGYDDSYIKITKDGIYIVSPNITINEVPYDL